MAEAEPIGSVTEKWKTWVGLLEPEINVGNKIAKMSATAEPAVEKGQLPLQRKRADSAQD